MTDAKVTITEITAADDAFDYGEGELVCEGPVCNRSVIGYHLRESYDHPDMDVQAFTEYWEITVEYPNTEPDTPFRACSDCMTYLEDIAPAIVAQTVLPDLLAERDAGG
jgi:hypothetical protein